MPTYEAAGQTWVNLLHFWLPQASVKDRHYWTNSEVRLGVTVSFMRTEQEYGLLNTTGDLYGLWSKIYPSKIAG